LGQADMAIPNIFWPYPTYSVTDRERHVRIGDG
jgi:hypothetical protein